MVILDLITIVASLLTVWYFVKMTAKDWRKIQTRNNRKGTPQERNKIRKRSL